MFFSRRTFSLSATIAPFVLPAICQAQLATPAGTDFEDASNRLAGLLQYVPGGVLDERLDLIWNDPERHVAAILDHGGQFAEDQPVDQLAFMSLYANSSELLVHALDLEDVTGFDFGQILQMVAFGSLPNGAMLLNLNVPAETLIPFWESHDYEFRENEYGTFWTIGETAEFDFDHPIQRTLLARLNNIAILDDHLIAYTQTSETLGRIMSTAAGDSPNRIAELESLIAGLPTDATSAWFMDGDILEFENLLADIVLSGEVVARFEDMMAESDDAVGPMPAIRTLCIGTTSGGHRMEELHNPDAREFIILETDEAGVAEQAAEVIPWRVDNMLSLNTGQPYSELLPDLEVEVLAGEFLRASLPLPVPRAMLPQMIQNRDTLLFAYFTNQ